MANYIAFTAPINPPSTTPHLTLDQIFAGLHHKVRCAQDFVGGAITSTTVLSESTDSTGRPVVDREVIFKEGDRKMKERCVTYHPMKVEFQQTNGSKVMNIVSQGAEGELYMTYTFEWLHEGMDEAGLSKAREGEEKMAKMAVESTLVAMREMVKDGRIK